MPEQTTEYRRISDLSEAVGKTVARTYEFKADQDALVIVFDDGAYLWIHARDVGGYGSLYLDLKVDARDRAKAGVTSDDDRQAAEREEERVKSLQEKQERDEYERLRAKFEGGARVEYVEPDDGPYCKECGEDDLKHLGCIDNYANGTRWRCGTCGHEFMTGPKPREE